jgi:hypothetical protein
MMLRVLALLLAVAFVQPAAAQPSAEVAIQEAIVQGNAAQVQALAMGDPSPLRSIASGVYYQRLARTHQGLMRSGATSIELVNIEWGPITVFGASAMATTFETWRTTYSTGPTEFARDRNEYALAIDEAGVWRVLDNSQPNSARSGEPALPPADSRPPSDDDAAEIPAGQSTSRNWSGYAVRGGVYTSVSGTWVVPEVPVEGPFGADAAWVGIGGYRTRDLIQAGTQSISSGDGRVAYQAWYEMLPDFSHPVPLTVFPGHTVNVSIDEQRPDEWLIVITNLTTGEVHQRTETYSSSRSSAEWVQEAPFARRRVLPLSLFGQITFLSGSAVRDGQSLSIADLGARAISMVDASGRPLAIPSPLGTDGQSFSIARTQ